MTEQLGDVDLSLDIMLMEALGSAQECEVSTHDKGSAIHDGGPGIWYVNDLCPNCDNTDTTLVCQRFKEVILGMGYKIKIARCTVCDTLLSPEEIITSVVKKNE